MTIKCPIVEYIPELIYTGNDNDRIKQSDIKNYYEYYKKNGYKGMPKSLKQCSDEIKKKLGFDNSKKSLTKNYLFGCKFEEKNKSDKINITNSNNLEIDITKSNKTEIIKSNQVEINDSDDEEM